MKLHDYVMRTNFTFSYPVSIFLILFKVLWRTRTHSVNKFNKLYVHTYILLNKLMLKQ